VAPYIGYTLARLGERPVILATAGMDFTDYRDWLEAQGVDTSGVLIIPEVFTASFFAGKDRINGQIALFYPGAMGYADRVSFTDLNPRPDFAMISPDDPAAMAKHLRECLDLGIPYAYDVSWQLARLAREEIMEGVLGCHMLVVNDYEMSMIADKTGLTETDPRLCDKVVVVTRGENGASIYAGGCLYTIPPVPPRAVLDPTGAGDAFRGGLLRGLSLQLPWAVAGRMGALCGTYALEHVGTQEHQFTVEGFIERYRQVWDDEGLLDRLV
jgi:adenosine kinase